MKGLCAVCQGGLFPDSLLTLENMPKDAQGFFEDADESANVGVTLQVVQCACCGLVQLNAKAVPYFRDVIRANAYSPAMAEFRLQQFHAWLTEINGLQDKKILEIGSGRGEYLELFKRLGVHAFGVEHAADSVAAATAAGHTVEQGYLGDAGTTLINGPFDAFVSFNFMEHWPDPGAVLTNLHLQLRSGAVGLIEVPNFDMILKSQLFSEFIPDHLFYFTAETLRSTLQRFGYEVLTVDSIWSDYILSARVKKREALNLDAFHRSKQKIIAEIRAYADIHASGGVAVWGAGHQALAMLSLAHLRDAVAFVVDSAPFKQNKYTPASNIYIDGPSALESGRVDTVIIMGAGYSDEILKMLRQNYPLIKHVAVLRDSHLEVIDV